MRYIISDGTRDYHINDLHNAQRALEDLRNEGYQPRLFTLDGVELDDRGEPYPEFEVVTAQRFAETLTAFSDHTTIPDEDARAGDLVSSVYASHGRERVFVGEVVSCVFSQDSYFVRTSVLRAIAGEIPFSSI